MAKLAVGNQNRGNKKTETGCHYLRVTGMEPSERQTDRRTDAQTYLNCRQTDRQMGTSVSPSADGVGVDDLTFCILQQQAEAAVQHPRGTLCDGCCMLVCVYTHAGCLDTCMHQQQVMPCIWCKSLKHHKHAKREQVRICGEGAGGGA